MLSNAILLTTLLGSAPGSYAPPPAPEPICISVPAAPARVDVQPFASTAVDGSRSWGATASYRLSSGELGEAFMVVDSDGSGEAQLMIDGEIIAHVAIVDEAAAGQFVTTTWQPPEISVTPEAIAEMMQIDLPIIVAESLPQEFKCSSFGKTAMRVAGVLWRAGTFAAGAACCGLSGPTVVGCAICAAGFGTANIEGSKVIDGHCD